MLLRLGVWPDAFGNALGSSIADSFGQSSGSNSGAAEDAIDRVFRENGNFANSPGFTFADSMAARQAASNPLGLPTSSAAQLLSDQGWSPTSGYGFAGDSGGITNWQNNTAAAQPSTVRAGDYGGSVERLARAQLGADASQREINNYVGQVIELNSIKNPRAINGDSQWILPGADTPAATSGLGVYGKDIALGEQIKTQAQAQARAQVNSPQVVTFDGITVGDLAVLNAGFDRHDAAVAAVRVAHRKPTRRTTTRRAPALGDLRRMLLDVLSHPAVTDRHALAMLAVEPRLDLAATPIVRGKVDHFLAGPFGFGTPVRFSHIANGSRCIAGVSLCATAAVMSGYRRAAMAPCPFEPAGTRPSGINGDQRQTGCKKQEHCNPSSTGAARLV